jgi:hypothetical protein
MMDLELDGQLLKTVRMAYLLFICFITVSNSQPNDRRYYRSCRREAIPTIEVINVFDGREANLIYYIQDDQVLAPWFETWFSRTVDGGR